MIQMHNAIMQILDLHIAVAYPMDYIPKDTPQHLLDTCRHLLLHEHVSEAPCTHPKELAINVLNQACLQIEQDVQAYQAQEQYLENQSKLLALKQNDPNLSIEECDYDDMSTVSTLL